MLRGEYSWIRSAPDWVREVDLSHGGRYGPGDENSPDFETYPDLPPAEHDWLATVPEDERELARMWVEDELAFARQEAAQSRLERRAFRILPEWMPSMWGVRFAEAWWTLHSHWCSPRLSIGLFDTYTNVVGMEEALTASKIPFPTARADVARAIPVFWLVARARTVNPNSALTLLGGHYAGIGYSTAEGGRKGAERRWGHKTPTDLQRRILEAADGLRPGDPRGLASRVTSKLYPGLEGRTLKNRTDAVRHVLKKNQRI